MPQPTPPEIELDVAQNREDLEQILALQASNLPSVLEPITQKEHGFVTIQHDLALLEKMNHPYPHVILRYQEKIAGYALVMLKEMATYIPILKALFAHLEKLSYQGKNISAYSFFIMGQICIDKALRGKGLFKVLYHGMRNQMAAHFDFVITEVADQNQRSLKAHHRVGFQTMLSYENDQQEGWHILLWDWR
ncbi:MAG: GNAT family N-acetyltransferase [Bacteroidota bacterium]